MEKQNKEREEDHVGTVLKIIEICIIIGVVYFFYNYANTYYSDELEIICLEKGYGEITDYKKIRDEQVWRDSRNDYIFLIECDNKVLKSQYTLDVEIDKYCKKSDKWGECGYYSIDYYYSKPYVSNTLYG